MPETFSFSDGVRAAWLLPGDSNPERALKQPQGGPSPLPTCLCGLHSEPLSEPGKCGTISHALSQQLPNWGTWFLIANPVGFWGFMSCELSASAELS